LTAQGWECNICGVVVHNSLEIINTIRQKPVYLARQNSCFPGNDVFVLLKVVSILGLTQRNSKSRTRTLLMEKWKSVSRARCTPKGSPVIQITLLLCRGGTMPGTEGAAIAVGAEVAPMAPCKGEGK
jgi:hypothetical protein